MWARRILISSGVAAASLLMVSGTAGAANQCVVTETIHTTNSCVVPPQIQGNAGKVVPTSSALPYDGTPGATAPVSTAPTSLPFTGADIEEMAIIGLGAVVAGGVLLRRRRLSA
jgi:uncharacterized surface anchored protein